MTCNGDCENCKFKDCVATYQEISKLDRLERAIKREMGVDISERKANRKTKIDLQRTKRA